MWEDVTKRDLTEVREGNGIWRQWQEEVATDRKDNELCDGAKPNALEKRKKALSLLNYAWAPFYED